MPVVYVDAAASALHVAQYAIRFEDPASSLVGSSALFHIQSGRYLGMTG